MFWISRRCSEMTVFTTNCFVPDPVNAPPGDAGISMMSPGTTPSLMKAAEASKSRMNTVLSAEVVTSLTPGVPVEMAALTAAATIVAGDVVLATTLTEPVKGTTTPAPVLSAFTTSNAVRVPAAQFPLMIVDVPATSTMDWIAPGGVALSTKATVMASAPAPVPATAARMTTPLRVKLPR